MKTSFQTKLVIAFLCVLSVTTLAWGQNAQPQPSYDTLKVAFENEFKTTEAFLASHEMTQLNDQMNNQMAFITKFENEYMEGRAAGKSPASLETCLNKFGDTYFSNQVQMKIAFAKLVIAFEPSRKNLAIAYQRVQAADPKRADNDHLFEQLQGSTIFTNEVKQIFAWQETLNKFTKPIVQETEITHTMISPERQKELYIDTAWYIWERKIAYLKTRTDFANQVDALITICKTEEVTQLINRITNLRSNLITFEKHYALLKKDGAAPKMMEPTVRIYMTILFDTSAELTQLNAKIGQEARAAQETLQSLTESVPDLAGSDPVINELAHKLGHIHGPIGVVEQAVVERMRVIQAAFAKTGKKEEAMTEGDILPLVRALLDDKAAEINAATTK